MAQDEHAHDLGSPRIRKREPANSWSWPGSALGHARVWISLVAVLLLASAASARAESCPNAAARTGPSTHLPDCRAYELVTPPDKVSGLVGEGGLHIGPDGSSVGYQSFSAFPGTEGFVNTFGGAHYTALRTAGGWTSVSEELPASEYLPFDYGGVIAWMNSSLGAEVNVYAARKLGQPENQVSFYLRESNGANVEVGPGLPPSAPVGLPYKIANPADMYAVGESADASRLLFDLDLHLWSFDETEEKGVAAGVFHSLYEYLGTGNSAPLLVGVDNGDKLISQCGTVLGAGDPTGSAGNALIDSDHNAMSTDGNVVFFTSYPATDGCQGSAPPVAELFARIDNGMAGARTVAISEPSKEDCAACDTEAGVLAAAHFEGASEDGSKVFFATTQPLLGDDTSRNIYEYDFDAPAGERVVHVSGGDATVSEPVADMPPVSGEGVAATPPAISEDGSHAYFVARGVLTKQPNSQGESAQPSADNFYVFERDATHPEGRIAFISVLSTEDAERWGSIDKGGGPDLTPDGRFAVFTSNRDLTPDDTGTARQVFEYDAQSGTLARVSVGAGGFNHNGNVAGSTRNVATIPTPTYEFTYEPSAYWSKLAVSANGAYVFFQSPVGLTPQALNEVPAENGTLVQNVYEYHDGNVSLISDGQDAGEERVGVKLETTDESGQDVFFTTRDPLVGQDSGLDLDIYDARVDGGFPAPAQPPACAGEACQGPLSGAPVLLSPGSEFQAGGNPPLAAPATVAKGVAKKKPKSAKKKKKKQCSRKAGRRASCARTGSTHVTRSTHGRRGR